MSEIDNSRSTKIMPILEIESSEADLSLHSEIAFHSDSFETYTSSHSKIESEKSSTIPFNEGYVGVNDIWDDVMIFDGRIVEIFDKEVELECLIDVENKIFERRTFYRPLFKNLDIGLGNYVRVRVMVKSEKMTIIIREGEKLVNKDVFEEGTFIPKEELEVLGNLKIN